ncbi:MAG: hypothetical protein FJX25_00495 [Alphaproteobacteria bacterium]|nr:hypothetical protein [Alphaproteobacteria bacterium]
MNDDIAERLQRGAERFVAAREPHRATIRDLYGEGWDAVADPADVGRTFRKMVAAGQVPGLRLVKQNKWLNQRSHVEYVRSRG